MHIHFLDPYRHRSSPVHALDPRVKLVLILSFILTCGLASIGAWPVYILLFALIFSIELLSALGIRYIQQRSLLALPFILAAFPLIFIHGQTILFSTEVGPWQLTAYVEGFERFISVALKSWLSVQAAVLLAASTPFPELLQAMRAVGLPRLLVSLFGLMWRYLFVLVDEALRLIRARQARSGESGVPRAKAGGSVAWRARVAGGMAGNLFLRAFERSDRIYMAMVARGYDGEIRALPMPPVPRPAWLALGGGLCLLVILLLSGFLFWG